MQDAQLISQASKVESLASDGLVSVSTGAGQPQKNMELSKFADSLGSSVPLQQNAEQVSITGLYARTSDGKMVELTKESVASVMDGLMGNPLGYKGSIQNANNILTNGLHYLYAETNTENNATPVAGYAWSLQTIETDTRLTQMAFGGPNFAESYVRHTNKTSGWSKVSWRRIDNFGYNSLAELSSGVAEQMRTVLKIGTYYLEANTPFNTGIKECGLYKFTIGSLTYGNPLYFIYTLNEGVTKLNATWYSDSETELAFSKNESSEMIITYNVDAQINIQRII